MGPAPGEVVLVGAGPGDPGLITVAGRRALEGADVVLYDHLVSPRILCLAPATAELVLVGKRAGHCVKDQGEIQELLIAHARAGRRVVRLKGGDPYVFGRGAEEVEALRAAGIPHRVVPGVSAGLGATAYAGLAVTHRDASSAVAFVTGHETSDERRLDWDALGRFPGTIVVYMGVTRCRSVCEALIRGGHSPGTPAAYVRWGATPRQVVEVSTLGELPERVATKGLMPPALLVIGEVVGRRDALTWYERLPLFGRTIVVTRPRAEALRAAEGLDYLGAEALIAPTVEILPPVNYAAVDAALAVIESYDWLIFTSGNGVRFFLDRLLAMGRDLRALGRVRIAAIGPATAGVLAEYRLRADLLPERYRSEELADALLEPVAGKRVLLARADRGRVILREELERVAHVDQVAVYRNTDATSLPEDVHSRLIAGEVDWITLTSSAIAERLLALLPEEARGRIGSTTRLATISPVTTAAVERLGFPVSAEAETYTWEGVVEALTAAECRVPSARTRVR